MYSVCMCVLILWNLQHPLAVQYALCNSAKTIARCRNSFQTKYCDVKWLLMYMISLFCLSLCVKVERWQKCHSLSQFLVHTKKSSFRNEWQRLKFKVWIEWKIFWLFKQLHGVEGKKIHVRSFDLFFCYWRG